MNNNIIKDKNGITHIVSLSGGKDSTALALSLKIKMQNIPFNYVCTPTGNELPEMQNHWKNLSQILGKQIITVTNGTLENIIDDQRCIPNFQKRFCTRILKLAAMAKFLRLVSPAICYVGLRADEEEREGATHGGDYITPVEAEKVIQRYPFKEWGYGLKEVLAICEYYQITIPDRTDCAWCFYQQLGEWYNLYKNYPDIYEQGSEIEKRRGYTFRSPGRDTWPASLEDLKKRFDAGDIPERSLNMMAKRKGMCRICSL